MINRFSNGQKIKFFVKEGNVTDYTTINRIISNRLMILDDDYDVEYIHEISLIEVMDTPPQM